MKKIFIICIQFYFVASSIYSYGQSKFIAVDNELIKLNKEKLFNGSVLVAKIVAIAGLCERTINIQCLSSSVRTRIFY